MLLAPLALAACSVETTGRDGGAGDPERGSLGKADIVGACEPDQCGGPAAYGTCWCDDECESYGDCCSNKVEICDEVDDGGDAGGDACHVGGCSGQLCVGEDDPGFSTCEFLPWYACFQFAECGNFGPDGACGWDQTPEFVQCMDEMMGKNNECAAPPADLDKAEHLEFDLFEAPEGCFGEVGLGQFIQNKTISSEAEFFEEFHCVEDVDLAIDFDKVRIQRAVIHNNPGGDVAWVVRDGERVVVGTSAAAYCGGAAPPDTPVYVTIPAGPEAVEVQGCIEGSCTCGPFGCPP